MAGYCWTGDDLNRTVEGRLNPSGMATVYVTQSMANIYYSIYYDNVLAADFLTHNGTDAANSVEGTDVIAAGLVTSLTSMAILPVGATITRIGSTISRLPGSTRTKRS
jgi:hypothetical protein